MGIPPGFGHFASVGKNENMVQCTIRLLNPYCWFRRFRRCVSTFAFFLILRGERGFGEAGDDEIEQRNCS